MKMRASWRGVAEGLLAETSALFEFACELPLQTKHAVEEDADSQKWLSH
jgi:hypothetical protein